MRRPINDNTEYYKSLEKAAAAQIRGVFRLVFLVIAISGILSYVGNILF